MISLKDPTVWKCLEVDCGRIKTAKSSVNSLMKTATQLRDLVITNNKNGKVNNKALMSVIVRAKKSLKMLNIQPGIMLKDGNVVRLRCLIKLEVLDISGDLVASNGIEAMASLGNLRKLTIIGKCFFWSFKAETRSLFQVL